jgi:hypothetical protein
MQKSLKIFVHDKAVTLTPETIEATFQWYADNARLCASEAMEGAFFVNDLDSYVSQKESEALNYERQKENGPDGRLSLAFIQRAYYIQSGESVPMLSN